MTPQERQLVTELFDRLAALENSPRDPSAEAVVREGFRRAPNAAYALVQTVLLQDEALKAANARIQQYEQSDAQGVPPPNEQRGFLDNMRDSLFGREQPRGSVPRVPQGGGQPMDAPAGASQGYRSDPWGQQQPGGMGMQPAAQMQQPMAPPPQQGGGSSFLGTAAAAAAGMIGGSLLMSGIRSAMAGHQAGPAQSAFDQISGSGGDRSPWSSNSNNDLARDLGVNDVSGGSRQAFGDTGQTQRAGLFDDTRDNNDDNDNDNDSSDDDYDSDSDDGDSGYDEA